MVYCLFGWVYLSLSQVLFTKRVNRKYEEINEKSVETEYEFLTEQEMEDKGWSESLRLIYGFRLPCWFILWYLF